MKIEALHRKTTGVKGVRNFEPFYVFLSGGHELAYSIELFSHAIKIYSREKQMVEKVENISNDNNDRRWSAMERTFSHLSPGKPETNK